MPEVLFDTTGFGAAKVVTDVALLLGRMGEGCVVIELQVLEEAGFDVLARPEALLAAVANSAEALWRSHQPRWPR